MRRALLCGTLASSRVSRPSSSGFAVRSARAPSSSSSGFVPKQPTPFRPARSVSTPPPAKVRSAPRGVIYVDERDDARRMADDLDSSRSRVTGHEVKHQTPWLTFKHLTYEDPAGKTRKWDMVGRSTRAPNAVADAVCVFAVLRKSGEPDTTLLVRQFRPPLDAETIELPAGLVDGDESPEQTAVRELKEETGYVGVVAANAAHPRVVTPALPLSPGLSDETVVLVRVDVDLDDPVNANPTQELEGSEFISVLRVPVAGLRTQLDALADRGYKVFAGLYTMALGMEMGGK
jgi:8-oxo-dGTP pyrophosphatase MutT (NUDIX family)